MATAQLRRHPNPQCLLPRLCRPAPARLLIRLSSEPLRFSSTSASSSQAPPPLHGPSLRRGRAPPDHPDPFARAFDLAALRVPAAACAPLERRLRGHLLNWPRVRNVARLPNDHGLLPPGLSPQSPTPHHPAVGVPGAPAPPLTAVARREKLAREFNARGFLRFPNLARLSRPSPAARKRKEMKGDGGDEEATREHDRDKTYVVEVIGEGTNEEEDDKWKALVGEEGFGRGLWRMGPTRLLLLDESYAKRSVHGLPEAVKPNGH
nr:unnamed protein product [Digitaria exilis]